MRLSGVLLASIVAAVFSGCNQQSPNDLTSISDQTASTYVIAHAAVPSAETSSTVITVVGDDTAPQVAAALRDRGLSVSDDPDTLSSAKLIIVAEDAPNGTRDVHSKLAAKLAENRDASVLWVLTRMSLIDDSELVELLQTEVQDLLKIHGASPLELRFATDTEQTTVNSNTLKGWPAITQFLNASAHP